VEGVVVFVAAGAEVAKSAGATFHVFAVMALRASVTPLAAIAALIGWGRVGGFYIIFWREKVVLGWWWGHGIKIGIVLLRRGCGDCDFGLVFAFAFFGAVEEGCVWDVDLLFAVRTVRDGILAVIFEVWVCMYCSSSLDCKFVFLGEGGK
jgi:hypothetical protein